MRLLPAYARRLSHADLLDRLAATARAEFADPSAPPDASAPVSTSATPSVRGVWNPARDDSAVDVGRGVLDAYALALHVLWTYQEAWAAEGFLRTATLDTSIGELLAGVGYRPSPGAAATGFQYFRCRAGMNATLPQGFAVRAASSGAKPAATFETLAPLDLHPELNEVPVFWPTGATAPAAAPPGAPLEMTLPNAGAGGLFPPVQVADSLAGALQNERFGNEAARNAARARADAQKLADLMGVAQQYVDDNKATAAQVAALRSALQPVCKALCEAMAAAAPPPPTGAPGALTESQELLARQLRLLGARGTALADLEIAMARAPCDDDATYAARLAALARFLDMLVASLVQDARDQVVLMHGIDALGRLDQAFGAPTASQGSAAIGQSALLLLPPGAAPGATQTLPMIRPGDWFVLAEDVDTTDPRGNTTTVRQYRQAIQVRRAYDERSGPGNALVTGIQFDPPLLRAYPDLSKVTLLGNVTPVSHGAAVQEVAQVSADGRTVALQQGPLTWLRDPSAPSGRRPTVDLLVNGRTWQRVDSLLDPAASAAASGAGAYVVETASDGAVLRTSDGWEGTPLPALPVVARYRVGLGAAGNRDALALASVATPHPAVESTLNPLPTTTGVDPQGGADARTRGPLTIAATDRAVSIADVQSLALVYDGVLRARAVVEGTSRRARVAVIVAGPDDAALDDPSLQDLRAYLADRVPPGVQIRVANRVLVPLRAVIVLRRVRGWDTAQLARAVRLRLGVDVDADDAAPPGLLAGASVDLGAGLQLSSVYGALEGTPGLDSLVVKALYRDGAGERLHDRIRSRPDELLAWARPEDGTEGVALQDQEVGAS